MIRVSVRADEESAQVIVSGHAGHAEYGHDIVCAGVSVLTNTLANLARRWAYDGIVDLYLVQPEIEPSHIFVRTGGNSAVNAAIRTFIEAYGQIAEQYPDNVSLEILP